MLGRDFDSMAEKVQRAAERQKELTRNISHELRSPLARMRVAVELARRKAGELPEFDRLETEAQRLDSLIGQILSYTKLEVDPLHKATDVNLTDVVREVIENVAFECGSDERIVFRAQTDNDVTIIGQRSALVSAIENVLRNAVRHSPPDGKITVSMDLAAAWLIVEIADCGPGVDERDLPNLFEPFYRTKESAEKDGNGGTGLGLAIARRAVELHNGEIVAQNRATGGLVVRISLPSGD